MSERVKDYLGPYITITLLPELNKAVKLKDAGFYFAAVEKQIDVISSLYRTSYEGKENLRKWIDEIEEIEEYANTQNASIKENTPHLRSKIRNRRAKNMYREINLKIWDKIHAFGYFSSRGDYGPDIDDIDGTKIEAI